MNATDEEMLTVEGYVSIDLRTSSLGEPYLALGKITRNRPSGGASSIGAVLIRLRCPATIGDIPAAARAEQIEVSVAGLVGSLGL